MENEGSSSSTETSSEGADTSNEGSENIEGSEEEGEELQEGSGHEKKPAGAQAKKEPPKEEEFEEVKLGSTKAKLSKDVAKLVKDLQKGFYEKAERAAKLERREKMLQETLKDPTSARKLLRSMGVDTRQMSEDEISEALEEAGMTPEQKENRALKAELEAERETKKQTAEREKRKKDAEEYQKTQGNLDKEIGEAFKEAGLPKKRFYLARVAAEMLTSHKKLAAGLVDKPLSAKEACASVREDLVSTVREVIEDMDPKGIRELLGEKALKKLRDNEIVSAIERDSPEVAHKLNRPGSNRPASEKSKKPMNEYEWREHVKRMRV